MDKGTLFTFAPNIVKIIPGKKSNFYFLMGPKGGGGGGGGMDGGAVGKDETFCRRRWRVRFPRSDDLEPFFFTILLSVCTKRKKSELYFNVGILNAKHTSDG